MVSYLFNIYKYRNFLKLIFYNDDIIILPIRNIYFIIINYVFNKYLLIILISNFFVNDYHDA